MKRRRTIQQLRALAASTTFPAERESALAKAAELEALEALEAHSGDEEMTITLRFASFNSAMGSSMNQALRQEAIKAAEKALDAVQWAPGQWAVPGIGPLLDEAGLMQMYAGIAA